MATKTWKLGEVCKGGIITVTTTKNTVLVQGKEWDYSKGSTKGSNQSNAKEFTRLEMKTTDNNAESKLDWFLFDLTTSYYSGQIMDWIKSNVKFEENNW
jgi:uncharacterized GH25 family protein|tara:strand:- start:4943 stop:5239 length:297 start_codon:yes stop_codon:yes gene_type:complete